MLAWMMIATAWAGTVEIEVKVEDTESGHVFIDGKHRGEVHPGKRVEVKVPPGRHEVAVAYDADAHWLKCVGDVDAHAKETVVEVMSGRCTAIAKAEPRDDDTVRAGSYVSFTGAGANGTVEIAGRRHTITPGMSLIANVPDGTYDVKVHYFRQNGDGPVTATVRVWLLGVEVDVLQRVMLYNEVWDVGVIDMPSGLFIPDTALNYESPRRSCF